MFSDGAFWVCVYKTDEKRIFKALFLDKPIMNGYTYRGANYQMV